MHSSIKASGKACINASITKRRYFPTYKQRRPSMTKMGHRMSKRAIGVALVLVSMLIMLVCSTMGHPSSANAAASLQPNTIQDPFSAFCYFYYHDGKDTSADQDTATCQQESNAFLSLLQQDSPKGY